MTTLNLQRTPPARLREARRQLLEHGPASPALVAPELHRSWQRCLHFGLNPTGRPPGAPHASAAQLHRALERQRELVAHARPVMEQLFEQTRDTGSLVILADAQGLLLQALGDSHTSDRAQRVALRPGASWHEQWRGTNAIGTALADGAPVVVHAGEHFLERNRFLTCTAAPISDASGRVLGVLDITSDHRGYHPHTLALVRSAAQMVEHRLFDTRHAAALRLRLHVHAEGLGTPTEGLLALSEDGWIVGANAAARHWLGLARGDIGARTLAHVLQLDTDTLCAWAQASGPAARCARRPDGSSLWVRAEAGRQLRLVARPPTPGAVAGPALPGPTAGQPAPPAPDALAKLAGSDPTMQAAVHRARRVVDKPIVLLLQGESGTGKELFARAAHASGPRAHGPFVAVNCGALPEQLLEAELFGYRAGAFTGALREGAPGRVREAHGGTLFLDEIGDMPLAFQTHLLRVLQERQVQPLGCGKPVAVDFQLVCATHHPLRQAVAQGRFREDLYYRLNGLTLQLPALRERQDLPERVAACLQQHAPGRALTLAPDLAAAFRAYRWPGNLRQLNNALQTACALLDDDDTCISWAHLPDDLAAELRQPPPAAAGLRGEPDTDLRQQTRAAVAAAVQASAG
ncbi:MAG: sigma-54-dependent Fis family transcriptional regulator, partial [Rubrivivax sp.]